MPAHYSTVVSRAANKLLYHPLAQTLAKFFIVAFAYYATAKLGLMVPYKESVVTLIWLPTGIATGAILRWGKSSVVAIFIPAYLVERSVNLPVMTSLLITSGNTLAPLAAAYCLQYFKFNHKLVRQTDIGLLLSGAAISMTISASIGTLSLYLAGLVSVNGLLRIWFVWWLGDTIGVLLALPLVLNLTKDAIRVTQKQAYQIIAWLIIFAICELLISAVVTSLNKQFMLSIFLILPLLIWASMNFCIVGGSLVVISLSACVVWVTMHGFGVFYSIDMSEGIFSLWVFIISLVMMMLLISVLQSERSAAEKSAINNEKKLRAVVNGALDGIVTIDSAGNITEFNPAAERIFGYAKAQVLGKALGDVIVPPTTRSAHHKAHAAFVQTGTKHIFDKRIELNAMHADGTEFPVELTITSLKDAGEVLVTGFIRDISQQKKAQQEIENLAYYDNLTGLPNRRLLIDRFQRAAVTAKRMKTSCALIFLDLDHFKLLNDTRGHDIGDQLLVQVANRLQNAMRAGDTVARLSGDEFIVIIENIDGDQNLAYQQVSEVAQKLLMLLNQSYQLDMFEFRTTASLGITMFDGNDTVIATNNPPKPAVSENSAINATSTNEVVQQFTFEDHLRHSDSAMYVAKTAGRNSYRFYDVSTQQNIERHFIVESALYSALQNDEFSLHYQAIVDADEQIIGAETLLRWTHPTLGDISPTEFITIAEKNNQILTLGHWALSQACRQLQAWSSSEKFSKLRLSVNVSAKQFLYLHFVQDVRDLIETTQINPDLLKLELTETAVIDNIDDVIQKMNVLRKMGVRIALDDFGMGHSSLVYLKRLPISMLKIDQSFVRDVLTDSNDAAIIQMILAIGKTINCNVVSEGVEQLAQFEILKTYGCQYFQGFYFSKPVSISAFEGRINSGV